MNKKTVKKGLLPYLFLLFVILGVVYFLNIANRKVYVIKYDEFRKRQDHRFAIVKPRKVVSIDEDPGDKRHRKQRMVLDFDDNHRQETLLNKDYRWIHYWHQIPDDVIYTKQDMYEKLFNAPGKDIYLIMRKYYFDKQPFPRYWISGMHWL